MNRSRSSFQNKNRARKKQKCNKLTKSETNRQVLYQSIRDMLDAHYTYRQIVDILQVSRKTIAKVAHGNIENLCQSSCHSIWDSYSDEMLDGIRVGKTGKQIYNELVCRYKVIGKLTSFYSYIAQLADNAGIQLERYHHRSTPLPDGTIPHEYCDEIEPPNPTQRASRSDAESHPFSLENLLLRAT